MEPDVWVLQVSLCAARVLHCMLLVGSFSKELHAFCEAPTVRFDRITPTSGSTFHVYCLGALGLIQ